MALSAERRLAYADSSALVKLVIEERESAALADHLGSSAHAVATSRIAVVEISRATSLANPSEAVQHEVDRLLASCLLVALTNELLVAARALASASIRTLDAIHLASALRVQADEFLAYDARLREAAAQHGLQTTAPGTAYRKV